MIHTAIFSPTETKIIKIVSRRKKMMIQDITAKVYPYRIPFGAANGVAAAIRRINKKCEYHKLPWFLNGVGIGRGGKKVWKDKR